MAVSPPLPRSRTTLQAIIKQARRRARRRRLIHAAAAATLLLATAIVLALSHGSGRVSDRAQPNPAGIAPAAHLALKREPYLGVSCARPNNVACDRVGLAVWLQRPTTGLTATIDGLAVAMRLPCGAPRSHYYEPCSHYCQHVARDQPCGTYFEGFLRPAGLLNGALNVKPDRGRYYWIGTHKTVGLVRITATYPDGKTATVENRVSVRAGWG